MPVLTITIPMRYSTKLYVNIRKQSKIQENHFINVINRQQKESIPK